MDIEPASQADTPAILQLVAAAGLPLAGLTDHLGAAIVGRAEGRIVACAALEIHRDGALLRSVAVDGALRGHGLGAQIVSAALDLARRRGVTKAYLLTTTAEQYFRRFGFTPVTRDTVPPGVRRSVEFESACPAGAVAMEVLIDSALPEST
jgi:amino-acid N-acetyltransferase